MIQVNNKISEGDSFQEKKPKASLFSDASLWLLLLSNAITIFLAVNEGWSLLNIMWVYWAQSITIGFFNFIRMLQLSKLPSGGSGFNSFNGQQVKSDAFFFLLHFGFFHFAYFIFLFAFSVFEDFGNIDVKYILLPISIFFLNHLFSFFYNRPKDIAQQDPGALFMYPYLRIIPMHLTIILGFIFSNNPIVLFLILKTFADAIMHVIEHKALRKSTGQISR